MTLTFGFYNSIGGDRTYDAVQMSSIFEGIINDGVFSNVGANLAVLASVGNDVTVGSGRAWFKKTWTDNDATITIDTTAGEALLSRLDEIVLEVNSNDAVRANSIKLVKGVAAANPVRPTLTHTSQVNQYSLATIRRRPGATSVIQSDITNRRGTAETPYISGALQQTKITTYPSTETMNPGDVLLIDGDAGARKITGPNFLRDASDVGTAGIVMNISRRSHFRGKNLGGVITGVQRTQIENGTFEDIWLGDYWLNDGSIWRIVDFNYWQSLGDEGVTPHIVVVPDEPAYNAAMNPSNTTLNGYGPCSMRSAGLTGIKNEYSTIFGEWPPTFRDRLISTTNADGQGTARGWYDCTMELMSESMLYGAPILGLQNSPGALSYPSSIATQQFALFKMYPEFIRSQEGGFWLRDIATGGSFVKADFNGGPESAGASAVWGVRPFAIVG